MSIKYLQTILFSLLFTTAFSQNVSNFKIEGNKKLKTSFINKVSRLSEQSVLDSTLIEEDIKLLKRLPSIAHANYTTKKLKDGSYEVVYIVEENFTIIPSVNVYTSNDDEFAYRLGLYEFNLFGQNMTFGGFYQKDISKRNIRCIQVKKPPPY